MDETQTPVEAMDASHRTNVRILLVEDEVFTRRIMISGLTLLGYSAQGAATAAEAWQLVAEDEPHVVLCDLDLGIGPSGTDVLWRLFRELPWIVRVAYSSHGDPTLAAPSPDGLPPETAFISKSRIEDFTEVHGIIEDAMVSRSPRNDALNDDEVVAEVSPAQAEVLRLIAQGDSNATIAHKRETSLRATEGLVQRTFAALGVEGDPDMNPRVAATRLWLSGRVRVRRR